jgi:S-methyl-5-thioribose-1-phosphate isomerase
MIVNGTHYKTVWFENSKLHLVNQPLLPHSFEIVTINDYQEAARAIRTMVVRGAPAIGATAAYGMALAAMQGVALSEAAKVLTATRPTAQDLFYAVRRVQDLAAAGTDPLDAARRIAADYEHACEQIGEHGAELIEDGMRLNTHCNAGWLATVDWGTATAPMYKAKRQGKRISVLVDETRPRCQGSRITAFELGHEGIDHAVIVDSATGYYMWRGEIDLVIVGADRIAANGDVANKIGTYSSAVAASANNIPFYVAAPLATVDLECPCGMDIPIEERAPEEVACMFGRLVDPETGAVDDGTAKGPEGAPATVRIAPETSPVKNPAFDVTPAELVTGIITERGIFPPDRIRRAFGDQRG